MTLLLMLSCPVGAHPTILLVLLVQKIPYQNDCTNQRKYFYMGHERFRKDPPPPPPTRQDVLSSICDINVIFRLNYENLADTPWRKRSIIFELPY